MKRALIGLISLALLLLIGGAYFFYKNKTQDTVVSQDSINTDIKIAEVDKTVDSDKDGLSDYDEINVYKTDPKNSDTDGDSFKDGLEVANHYDPLSSGALEVDIEICAKLEDETEQKNCYTEAALLSNDGRVCYGITNESKLHKCISTVVDKIPKEESCNWFKEESEIRACKSSLEDFKDISRCNGDTTCEIIHYRQNNDINVCKLYQEDGSEEEMECYVYFAEKNNDINVCNMISGIAEKDVCFLRFADNYFYKNVCELIKVDSSAQESFELKSACIALEAKFKKDLSKCDQLVEPEKYYCQREVVVAIGDYNLCYNIADVDEAGTCLFSIAKSTDNKALCNSITSAREKFRCYNTMNMTDLIDENLCKGISDTFNQTSCYKVLSDKI